MRDAIVILLLGFCFWVTVKRAAWGALVWVFVSVSSFHQQGYATAGLPVAAAVAALILLTILFRREPMDIPWQPPVVFLAMLTVWINITYVASPSMSENYDMWAKVMKIFGFNFIVLALLQKRDDVHKLIWVIVLSLAVTGAKGGVFTLLTGGGHRVWGPGGFIGGNNEFAVALVMTIPLMHYLRQQTGNVWIRHALLGAMVLCGVAAIGSHSRGALLAISAMTFMLVLKSQQRGVLIIGLLVVAPLVIMFMPEEWSQRMSSITSYEEDQSAMGRINAWTMAWNLSLDRLFGGGFENVKYEFFAAYGKSTEYMQGPHSIYFQILGQHGMIGFLLFIGIGISTWRCATAIARHVRASDADRLMARMIQVSLMGFAVGGAFLALAYFDVPYYLMIAAVRLRHVLDRELAEDRGGALPLDQQRAKVPS